MVDGDLYYFIFPARDLDRSQRFFSGVFGWEFGDRGHITSIADPHGGLAAHKSDPDPQLWLHASDVEATVAKVRELGGEATDVQESPSGWSADCKDPGGTSFSIGRMRPEFDVGEGGATSGPGTLRYFTIPVADLAVAKNFYRGIFGWQYDPKNSHDTYAHVAGTEPACGLVISAENAPSIWFMTADIGASTSKVRELGGTAKDPSISDSGQSAACMSDDGTHFHLWQPAPGL